MIINKQLKHAEFSYDEKDKTFTITEEGGNRVILNKVYSFAFMRFVVRMAQRNWLRNPTIKNKEVDENEAETLDNPNQTEFLFPSEECNNLK